mmetsp:Transcript_3204/g.7907  ORF Transcript_3204/g.7907 Transcript_3204/m.7907 type:complete len:200 (-) Transcript_3204:2616-3215(-)
MVWMHSNAARRTWSESSTICLKGPRMISLKLSFEKCVFLYSKGSRVPICLTTMSCRWCSKALKSNIAALCTFRSGSSIMLTNSITAGETASWMDASILASLTTSLKAVTDTSLAFGLSDLRPVRSKGRTVPGLLTTKWPRHSAMIERITSSSLSQYLKSTSTNSVTVFLSWRCFDSLTSASKDTIISLRESRSRYCSFG